MEMRACGRACMCDQIEKKKKLRTRINNAIVVNKLRRNHTFVFVNIYLGKVCAQMNTFTWENCVRK